MAAGDRGGATDTWGNTATRTTTASPNLLTTLGLTPKTTTTTTAPATTTTPSYQQTIRAKLGITPATTTTTTTPATTTTTPRATTTTAPTWTWGTNVIFGTNANTVTGTPTWQTWQTTAPLYTNTDYINPQTGRNWGKSPRLNMALAEATGYTGNFGGNEFQTFYNSLSADRKAEVDRIRASYPANTATTTTTATTKAGATTTGGNTTTNQPNTTNAAPTAYVKDTNVPQGGTDPKLVSGGAAPTATGPGGVGPGTAGGLGGSWINTNPTPTGEALPAGVTTVMPTFTQGGDFKGYSPSSNAWGSNTNMMNYYPR